MTTFSNLDDLIKTSDIIERIDDLYNSATERESEVTGKTILIFDDESEQHEYEALLKLQTQAEGYSAWGNDILISEGYFEAYCRELVEDCGHIPSDLPWFIADAIDWGAVARNLDRDYADLDFDGVTYKMRA